MITVYENKDRKLTVQDAEYNKSLAIREAIGNSVYRIDVPKDHLLETIHAMLTEAGLLPHLDKDYSAGMDWWRQYVGKKPSAGNLGDFLHSIAKWKIRKDEEESAALSTRRDELAAKFGKEAGHFVNKPLTYEGADYLLRAAIDHIIEMEKDGSDG